LAGAFPLETEDMLGRLLPRETNFFDFFDQHAAIAVQAAKALCKFADKEATVEETDARIRDLEHDADRITHACMEALHRTFITPIDRWEIHRLVGVIDDVVDLIHEAAAWLARYEIVEMPEPACEATRILVRSTEAVERAVRGLRKVQDAAGIKQECVTINHYENEADAVFAKAITALFKEEKDPILILKLREIYTRLEKASDACEDVANIIEGVVLEHA
jgi:uncharacterized protein